MIKEAIQTVEKLNNELKEHAYEENKDNHFLYEYAPFDLTTDGEHIIISLFDNFQLWFNEEDERKYIDEEADEYEPLEGFLRREAQKIIDQISRIKLN